MKQYKRIFIIGHPGAGKALIAKETAKKLGWKFVDADFGLEFHMGRMLNEILGEQGTISFRSAETKVFQQLKNQENVVVTTDAGIIFNKDSKRLLSDDLVVYLKVSTTIQLERTKKHTSSLLSIDQHESFFDKLHAERDHLYSDMAALSIDGDDGDVDKHVMQIVEATKK